MRKERWILRLWKKNILNEYVTGATMNPSSRHSDDGVGRVSMRFDDMLAVFLEVLNLSYELYYELLRCPIYVCERYLVRLATVAWE